MWIKAGWKTLIHKMWTKKRFFLTPPLHYKIRNQIMQLDFRTEQNLVSANFLNQILDVHSDYKRKNDSQSRITIQTSIMQVLLICVIELLRLTKIAISCGQSTICLVCTWYQFVKPSQNQYSQVTNKLNGVGPVDNRPFTNSLHPIVQLF